MNVSSTYLSHIDGFSDVDPNIISSKYSMYMLASTGDNDEKENLNMSTGKKSYIIVVILVK